jgi:hypothetical protein
VKEPEIELVKSHIVTDDVARLATFYATLVRASVVLNDYYVEVPAGAMSVEFSLRRFTGRTRRPGQGDRYTGPRSSSTSRPATSMRNTSGSPAWAWTGSRPRQPSRGGTAR